ncbi:DUF2726 domain-containing protein [Aristophania vespae]|uniref:DUF2726 domain-containing protein n=1 Tax=Aristophania vespae TaxID=2697033 RepID=UPI0038CFDD0D
MKADYVPEDPRQKNALKSYKNKRVDFLLINCRSELVLAIEYYGSGLNLSSDANDRMKVKRLVLQKAQIPLFEIPEKAKKTKIMESI